MSDKRLKMPTEAAQVVIKYLLDGQPCENVLYVTKYHTDAGPLIDGGGSRVAFDAGAADDVATNVKTWLQDHWAGLAGTQAQATEVDVIWNTVALTGPLQGNVYQDSDYPIPGTNTGDPVPNNVTVAVEMRTHLLGRSFHGRVYLVGMNTGLLDASTPNVLKTASLADVPAVFNELWSGLNGWHSITAPADRYRLGVMSYVHNGAVRSPAIITDVSGFALSDPYLDSMRRRLPGHNRHR